MKEPPTTNPPQHTAHTTPYWFNGVPTSELKRGIHDLQTYINTPINWKEPHTARNKFTSVDKWASNDQIHHKLSNPFWQTKRDFRHANNTNTKYPICPIHGKPPEKTCFAQIAKWTHGHTSYPHAHKMPTHSPTQPSCPSNSSYASNQQTHKILYTHKRMKPTFTAWRHWMAQVFISTMFSSIVVFKCHFIHKPRVVSMKL